VHTREGVPSKPADLQHAGVRRARHVILLQPPGADQAAAQALSAASAMSLATVIPAGVDQSIVVQVPGAPMAHPGCQQQAGLRMEAGQSAGPFLPATRGSGCAAACTAAPCE
jgi:hypothetical protein